VNAGIGDPQRGPAVHFHVGRPGFRGSDAFVGAAWPLMRVRGYQGAITEAGLFCHSTVCNISRNDQGTIGWR
jgi:diadenosine tetraphosphate (Ap4A) HIT family hydrolase